MLRAAAVKPAVAAGERDVAQSHDAVASSNRASRAAASEKLKQPRPQQLLSSASAAAAAAGFSMGIAPAQGLLDTPPHAPLPASWRRLTALSLAAFIPSALFHEYLYARMLHAGFALDGELEGGGPSWGLYPVLRPTASQAQIDVRAAWGQAFVYFAFVFWLACTSTHFVYRSLSVLQANPLRCRAWVAGCALALCLTLAFCHASTAVAGAPSLFVGAPWDAWLAVALFNAASLALVGALKRVDSRRFERTMMSLRLSFDTRLGMYSPR